MEAAATTGPAFLSVALPKLNRFLPFSIYSSFLVLLSIETVLVEDSALFRIFGWF